MDEDIVINNFDDFKEFQERLPIKRRHELYKPVVEYTLEGVYLRSFESITQASYYHNISGSAIGNICKGRFLYSGKTKSIFLYRGDDITERLKKLNPVQMMLPAHASTNKEVCEYTLGGRFLFKWPSYKMAGQSMGVSSQIIASCCKGRRLFVDKRIFLYPEDDIKQRVKEVKAELYRLSQKRPKYREVDVYSLNGKFLKAYPSASAASRDLNMHVSDITRCCNGCDGNGHNKYTAKGKIFLWVGDSISDRLNDIKKSSK